MTVQQATHPGGDWDDDARVVWSAQDGSFRCVYLPEAGFYWESARYPDPVPLTIGGYAHAEVSQIGLLLNAVGRSFASDCGIDAIEGM